MTHTRVRHTFSLLLCTLATMHWTLTTIYSTVCFDAWLQSDRIKPFLLPVLWVCVMAKTTFSMFYISIISLPTGSKAIIANWSMTAVTCCILVDLLISLWLMLSTLCKSCKYYYNTTVVVIISIFVSNKLPTRSVTVLFIISLMVWNCVLYDIIELP